MHLFTILTLATSALGLHHPTQQVPLGVKTEPQKYAVQTPPLDTEWTYEVGTNPWPQYPRPKLARSEWKSLNGIWTYGSASGHSDLSTPPFNQTLPHEVLVPFCLESGLSGIQATNALFSWYRTTFTVPSNWTGDRVLLNFGAVDYEATVFVNGRTVAFNRGGFFAFTVDVTDYLEDGSNELIVFAFDPTDSEGYVVPVGKQTLNPSHIFYRPCSGIWQSVWIESAPTDYISDLTISGNADGQLYLNVSTTGSSDPSVEVAVFKKGSTKSIARHKGTANTPFVFNVSSPKTWSPDSPNLYDVTIKAGNDSVGSYTGFRTITTAAFDGVQRVVLNGEVIFPFGTLDQGYWPDGLFTPPTYEAMAYDIKMLKKLGYNMLRKHVKVESALYYSAADELGILIMQDMPNLGLQQIKVDSKNYVTLNEMPDDDQQEEFERQVELMITQLRSYSSVFAWVIYNEGWGQHTSFHPEFNITERIRELDPTRLVNAISGWHDFGAGDFSDNHHYANPQCGVPWSSVNSLAHDPARTGFQGEFGGLGHNVSADHLWKVKQAIDQIDQTYELFETLELWNRRGHYLLTELLSQIELYSCAGGVWTQTTDVEGEINGMLTYDRRILRNDIKLWTSDIQALYDASARRSNGSYLASGHSHDL